MGEISRDTLFRLFRSKGRDFSGSTISGAVTAIFNPMTKNAARFVCKSLQACRHRQQARMELQQQTAAEAADSSSSRSTMFSPAMPFTLCTVSQTTLQAVKNISCSCANPSRVCAGGYAQQSTRSSSPVASANPAAASCTCCSAARNAHSTCRTCCTVRPSSYCKLSADCICSTCASIASRCSTAAAAVSQASNTDSNSLAAEREVCLQRHPQHSGKQHNGCDYTAPTLGQPQPNRGGAVPMACFLVCCAR